MNNIFDFNEYILENSSTVLPFLLSDRLFDILDGIDHPIAAKLIDLHGKGELKKYTYIDIDTTTFSPNVDLETIYKRFTFVNSNKVIDTYKSIFRSQNVEIPDDFDFAEEVRDTTPTNDAVEKEFWKKNRTAIKIGSFIKKLFGDEFKDAGEQGRDITSFVNIFYAKRKESDIIYSLFEIVEGNDIVKYYNQNTYSKGGTLNNSCMKYSSCSNYIQFYAKNPVKMLILKDPDNIEKIVGRALVWENLEKPEGRTFMDRIYYTSEKYIEIFKNYAKTNSWLYKEYQNMDEMTNIIDGKTGENLGRITLKTEDVFDESPTDKYPYCDTLCYFAFYNGYLTNDYRCVWDANYILRTTDGVPDGMEQLEYVEHYGRDINIEDLTWCTYGEEYRLYGDFVEYNGDYATGEYADEYLAYSEYEDGQYFKIEDVVYSNKMRDYIKRENAVEVIGDADFDTLQEALDNYNEYLNENGIVDEYDSDKDFRIDDATVIDYTKNDKKYYFDYDENCKTFVKAIMPSKKIELKHPKWDKNNLVKKDDKWYFFEDQAQHDKQIGQFRIFDKKNY